MAYQSGRYFCFLILSIVAATLVTNLQQDIMAKPFSFCMPGHKKVSRKVIMIVGAIVNAVLGMVFLAHPDLALPDSLLVAVAAGFVGMAVYLLAVRITFKVTHQWGASYLIKTLLMFLLLGAGIYYKFLQEMTVAYPLIVIAIGYGICWRLWRWLGKDLLARELCGKLAPGMMPGWNMQKTQKIRRTQMLRKMGDEVTDLQSRSENLFISKMQEHKFLSRNRYIWGSLYADLGSFFLYLKPSVLVGCIAMLLYFGYWNTGNFNLNQIVFLIPCIGAINMKLPTCPSLLLPGGRREIFTGILAVAFFNTIIGGIAVILLAIISNLAEPFLPQIHIKNLTLSYQAIDISKFYLFLLIIPIAFSLTVMIRRRLALRMIIVILLIQAIVFGHIFSRFLEITIPPVAIPIAIVACWLIFVMLAYNFCMKKCLVSQTKG